MQNLDPSGEYLDAEVKEALSGASGSRDWAFRYELLDTDNNFIKEIDYVQSCTIDNNSLADIKRTAKFNILDTGTINYLKDRIKPYVRLNMPKESTQTYDQTLTTLNPDVWWKMDEPTQSVLPSQSATNIADGTTYNTIGAAYVAVLENALVPYIDPVGGANRSEFWAKIVLDGNRAVRFDLNFYTDTGSTAFNATFELYFSSGDATSISEMELLLKSTQDGGYSLGSYPVAFPRAGTYYVRWYDATGRGKVSTTVQSAVRAYDSSGKENHGVATQTFSAGTPIVRDGGRSAASGTGQISFETDFAKAISTPTLDGISVTSWLKASSGTAQQEFYTDLWSNTTQVGDYKDFEFYVLVQGSTVWISYRYLNVSSNQLYHAEFQSDQALPRDGKNHHITASVSPAGFSFYLDGRKVAGTVTHYGQITGNPTAFRTTWAGAWAYTFNDTDTVWDDFSLFTNGALSDSTVRDLYLKGLIQSDTRKGYVEWPQGVFLLSSPTRTMVEGNTVVREVEAYDQLLALKEDSFDRRITAEQGSKYTDIIANILGTTAPFATANARSGFYTNVGGKVLILSDTSLRISTDGVNNMYSYTTETGAFLPDRFGSVDGFSFTASITPYTATSGVKNWMRVVINDTGFPTWDSDFGFVIDSTGIYTNQPMTGVNTAPVAYNANTHKFLRIREEAGMFLYETSPDSSNWTLFDSVTNPFKSGTTMTIRFTIDDDMGNATTNSAYMTVNNLQLVYRPIKQTAITKSSLTIPRTMEWEPGTSKLDAINDLLAAINYTSATYDENGVFVAEPYVVPSQRGSEFTYATDEDSIITGDVAQTVDLFKVPNKWVLVVSNPDQSVIVGTYTNKDPMSATSTVARGRTIVDYRTEQDAADQVTLDAKVARLAFEASQVYEKIIFKTGLIPIHSDSDVYNLIIDGMVIDNKYAETAWSMELSPGSTMTHEVRRITNV